MKSVAQLPHLAGNGRYVVQQRPEAHLLPAIKVRQVWELRHTFHFFRFFFPSFFWQSPDFCRKSCRFFCRNFLPEICKKNFLFQFLGLKVRREAASSCAHLICRTSPTSARAAPHFPKQNSCNSSDVLKFTGVTFLAGLLLWDSR